jgi:hypothetical protein
LAYLAPTGAHCGAQKVVAMDDLIVAAGAIAIILGALLLGFSGNMRRRARNFCLTFGWLMVIFGLGAEAAALVQSERSAPEAAPASP